jgi:uncharacterized Tic20 family protein
MHPEDNKHDYSGAFAEGFFIAGLLFVGLFYIALWGLYALRYKKASSVTKNHIKQSIIASSISTLIFVILNVFIVVTGGYASATGLVSLEIYFMLIVPVFLLFGLLGFSKAVNHKDYKYPVVARLSGIKTWRI